MRAIEHAHAPVGGECGQGWRGEWFAGRFVGEVEDVTGDEAACGVAAELAEFEGAAAAEIGGDVEAASDEQVAAHAAAFCPADGQRLPCLCLEELPRSYRFAFESCAEVRAGEAQGGVGGELEGGAGDGHLQPRRALGVAEQAVAEAEGLVVHRAGGGNADCPEVLAAGPVLHGGGGAAA